MRSWVAAGCGLLALGPVLAVASCGSRTGLLVTPGVEDAATPSVDASPPPVEASTGERIRYLVPSQAPEGVYTYALGQFDPPTGAFTDPVQLSCLASVRDRPVALAPRCDGTVFVQFAGGSLWRVEADTLACSILQPSWPTSVNTPLAMTSSFSPGGAELLYFVAPPIPTSGTEDVFGWVNPTTLAITYVGYVRVSVLGLTASSAGQLFAFNQAEVDDIDEATGAVPRQTPVPMGPSPLQSFAFWGGSFYFFNVTTSDATDVVRWARNDFSTSPAGHTDQLVLAVGVSPCAPPR